MHQHDRHRASARLTKRSGCFDTARMPSRTNPRATQLLPMTAGAFAAVVIHMQHVQIEGLL
jgi:hypothetical protein